METVYYFFVETIQRDIVKPYLIVSQLSELPSQWPKVSLSSSIHGCAMKVTLQLLVFSPLLFIRDEAAMSLCVWLR